MTMTDHLEKVLKMVERNCDIALYSMPQYRQLNLSIEQFVNGLLFDSNDAFINSRYEVGTLPSQEQIIGNFKYSGIFQSTNIN